MKKRIFALISAMIFAVFCLSACEVTYAVKSLFDKNESSSAVSSADADNGAFAPGENTEKSYKNEFFGMIFEQQDLWLLDTVEELKSLNGWRNDTSDEEYYSQLKNTRSFVDMRAVSSNGNSVNVTVENLSLLLGEIPGESEYAEYMQKCITSALRKNGIEVTSAERQTIEFSSGEYPCITITGEQNGLEFFQTTVLIKKGAYAANVTASSYFEDTNGQSLALFLPTDDNEADSDNTALTDITADKPE